MDDFIRIRFAATGDARQMVTDAEARYYGAVLDDSTIVPVDGEQATVFPTRFSDWMASHTQRDELGPARCACLPPTADKRAQEADMEFTAVGP